MRIYFLKLARTTFLFLFFGCSNHDQSIQPSSTAFVPPAGKTMVHPTVPECWNALGGTCCDIKGDTSVTIGTSISYRYVHNQTKIDSIGWNFVTADPGSFTLHASDSIAVLTFGANFKSGKLHAYAKGAGWICEDGLAIHQ